MIDIRAWPVDRIMCLPDHVFGQRWVVNSSQVIAGNTTNRWLVQRSLPNRFVLWSLRFGGLTEFPLYLAFKFAMGDQTPADEAAFDGNPRLFPGKLDTAGEEGDLYVSGIDVREMNMRRMIQGDGLRFVCSCFNPSAAGTARITVSFEISSVPSTIPSCLSWD